MASFFKCIWPFSGCMKNSENPSTLIVHPWPAHSIFRYGLDCLPSELVTTQRV